MKERFFKNKELNNKKFLKFKKISNFREHSIRNSNLNCQYKLKIYNITNKLIIKKKKMGKINYLKVRNSKCRAKPYRTAKKQKVHFI